MTFILTQNSLIHMLLGNTLHCRGLILSHCRNRKHCYNTPLNAKLKMQHGSGRNANPVFPPVHNSSLPTNNNGRNMVEPNHHLFKISVAHELTMVDKPQARKSHCLFQGPSLITVRRQWKYIPT